MIETSIGSLEVKYDPGYCIRVIELGAEGKSMAQIAATLGISVSTLKRWEKDPRLPEFKYALELARTNAQAFMEELGLKGIKGVLPKFNPAAWQFAMKNRFKDDYKDVTETKIGIEHEIKEMSDEEMEEQIKLLVAKKAIDSGNSGTPLLIEASN